MSCSPLVISVLGSPSTTRGLLSRFMLGILQNNLGSYVRVVWKDFVVWGCVGELGNLFVFLIKLPIMLDMILTDLQGLPAESWRHEAEAPPRAALLSPILMTACNLRMLHQLHQSFII